MMIIPSEPANRPSEPRPDHHENLLKRSVDVVSSIVGMLLLWPIFVVLVALIKLDSPGPIFYAQEPIGLTRRRPRNGRPSAGEDRRRADSFGQPFTIYK